MIQVGAGIGCWRDALEATPALAPAPQHVIAQKKFALSGGGLTGLEGGGMKERRKKTSFRVWALFNANPMPWADKD